MYSTRFASQKLVPEAECSLKEEQWLSLPREEGVRPRAEGLPPMPPETSCPTCGFQNKAPILCPCLIYFIGLVYF